MIRRGCGFYLMTWALAIALAPLGAVAIVYGGMQPWVAFTGCGLLGFMILARRRSM